MQCLRDLKPEVEVATQASATPPLMISTCHEMVGLLEEVAAEDPYVDQLMTNGKNFTFVFTER